MLRDRERRPELEEWRKTQDQHTQSLGISLLYTAVLQFWGVGHDRATAVGGVVTDASLQKSASATECPVRTWHQSLLRPTYQPSVHGDGVDTQMLRSLH